jgi:hypothetical protein
MDEFQKLLLKRLDLIIRLLLDRGSPEQPPSITSLVHRLIDLGFSPSETASIIGKPLNYVTALSSSKRAKSKKAEGSK